MVLVAKPELLISCPWNECYCYHSMFAFKGHDGGHLNWWTPKYINKDGHGLKLMFGDIWIIGLAKNKCPTMISQFWWNVKCIIDQCGIILFHWWVWMYSVLRHPFQGLYHHNIITFKERKHLTRDLSNIVITQVVIRRKLPQFCKHSSNMAFFKCDKHSPVLLY